MTKFAPHEALKLIAWGKLTFDERAVVHLVGSLLENEAFEWWEAREVCPPLGPSSLA